VSGCSSNNYTEDQSGLPEVIDFNYHVKPILSDKCFACHGPDKNALKADLHLDTPEGAMEHTLNSGAHAIVPGNINKSEAFQRITFAVLELQMPPPEFGLTLTDQEIAIIAKWIDQGAGYKPHWAFIKLELPKISEVKNGSWIQNPIDNFVLIKLEGQEVLPNYQADKETLLRRVTLDFIGLPPTISEINNFLVDEDDDGFEKVVDRLLSSTRYGERMAL
jgi:hypothetical protein